MIKMLPDHTYITPGYDLFFRFESDGSAIQAGFQVMIQEYGSFFEVMNLCRIISVCLQKNYSVNIPCYDSTTVTYLSNTTSPAAFCSIDLYNFSVCC